MSNFWGSVQKAEAPADNNKKQEVSEANIQGTGLDREENYDDDVATVAESSAAADTKIDLNIVPLNKWNSSLSQTEKSKKIWSIASRVEDGTLVFRVKTVEPYSYSYLPTVFEANTGREKVSFDNNKIDDNNFEVRFTGLADGHWKLYDFSLVDLNNKAITFTQRDLIGFNTGELIGKGTYAVASDITLPSGSYYNVVTDKKTIKVGETVKYTFKIKDATDPKITRISLRQDGKKGLAITTFYRSYLDDNGNAVAYETMYENDRGVMTLEDFAYKTDNNSREINVYSYDLKKINEKIAVEYSEGVLRGWIPKGSNWYYIKNDGTKATNTWVEGKYYVKSDGKRATNEWIKVGNSWYYTNYDGKYARNEWVDDYYLNNNGTRATSQWKDRGSERYFLKGDGLIAKNTWVQGNYYVKSDGAMAKNEWVKVGNSWYYVDYDGVYARNTWRDGYYLNSNGVRIDNSSTKQGWIQEGYNWYYIKNDGTKATNTWVGDYYVKGDGTRASSEWIKVGNSWYYTNYDGRYARNEWVGDYYLNNNGTRATSQWIDRGSERYFLKGDGLIAKNTWVQGNYYVKSDGAMAKNEWVKVGNSWYYVDYDGVYARNTWRDGYYLNSNGVRVTQQQTTRRVEVRKETIPYTVETRNNYNLPKGITNVIQEGRNGSYTVVRDDVYEGNTLVRYGQEQQINRVEPINRIVEVGMKEATEISNPGRIVDLKVGDIIFDHVVTDIAKGDIRQFLNKTYQDLMKESEDTRYEKANSNIDASYHARDNVDIRFPNHEDYWLGVGNDAVALYNSTDLVDKSKVNEYFIDYINIDRKAKGIAPLQYDDALHNLTEVRAQEMATYGHIRYEGRPHTRPDGTAWSTVLDQLPTSYKSEGFGENMLAYSVLSNPYQVVSEHWIAKRMFEQWKASPSHYEAMMDPEYTHTAVSFKLTTREGAKSENETNWMIGAQLFSSRH